MTSLEEARRLICCHVAPLAGVGSALEDCHQRVLRQEIVATEDSPAFDCAAVDGYATGPDIDGKSLSVAAEVRPGELPAFTVEAGQCARVSAGAAMPEGTSQVLPEEEVRRDGTMITPISSGGASGEPGESHVRKRGEDIRAGDSLLHSGRRLRAAELALLAQLGVTRLSVSPKPRVIHLVTGDELVEPRQQPGAGQVRDSNSMLVSALLAEAGATLTGTARCGDQLGPLVRGVSAMPDEQWDMLLISGGADRGAHDYGQQALQKLGFEIHFRGLAMRPGRSLVFGTRGHQCAFVIPGNPVSHLVAFQVAVRLALECMEAAEPTWPVVELELADNLPEGADGEITPMREPLEIYWPARTYSSQGRMRVRPLACHSASDLCAVVAANSLVRVQPGTGELREGAMVQCLLWRSVA